MGWLERLTEAGFRRAGAWRLVDGKPTRFLDSMSGESDVLYAFVAGDEVLYVGKTTMPLDKRMYGYQNPGPSQRTNIMNNARLSERLGAGDTVEIYVLVDSANLEHFGFRISLAAGLEDCLISTIKPPWNTNGHRG